MRPDLHKIRIEIPNGEAFMARVTVDGQVLKGIRRLWFELGQGRGPFASRAWSEPVTIHLEVLANLEIEGDVVLDRADVKVQR